MQDWLPCYRQKKILLFARKQVRDMKELSHSELWINTEYYVQAFRCVCSLLYLEKHNDVCQFINAKDFIDGKLHRFYINICALVDIHCGYTVSNSKRSKYKRMLKTKYPLYD
jgi:hypothetical protein